MPGPPSKRNLFLRRIIFQLSLMQEVAAPVNLINLPLRAVQVHTYHLCEMLSGVMLCLMAVFSPWAFGSTEPWSIWTLNVAGFVLGILLLIKIGLRKMAGFRSSPILQTKPGPRCYQELFRPFHWPAERLLGFCTLGFTLLSLIAAVNARATYRPVSGAFAYHRFVKWLPASFDSERTWQTFWTYLALFLSFWAACDWLRGFRTFTQGSPVRPTGRAPALAPRLKTLLWTLSLSGGVLACEGLIQRALGVPRLLFTVLPTVNQEASQQFASFAYRSNAAQYFNLLWPVSLGFWWATSRSRQTGPLSRNLLLFCTLLMAACPVLSTARAATLVDAGMFIGVTIVLILLGRRGRGDGQVLRTPLIQWVLCSSLVLALGLASNWKQLGPRFRSMGADLQERQQLYDTGERILHDYPLFGTGPGTFERVFQLYRGSPEAYWPAQLHNDWLEIRITLGWCGAVLLVVAFVLIVSGSFLSGAVSSDPSFYSLVIISLLGCLVQARWDFPLQVYSISFLFVLSSAILSSTGLNLPAEKRNDHLGDRRRRTAVSAIGA
jgi:hypothetical protein